MKYLFVKMRRDLAGMWTQFLSVFLMAFLGVLIYVGTEGTWYGMKTELKQYFQETNLASAWVYGTAITGDDLNEIEKIDGVTSTERVTIFASKTVFPDVSGREKSDLKLTAAANKISNPLTVSGINFDADGDGIWLDSDFAKAHSLDVGDSILIFVGTVQKALTIKGLVMGPEYVYYTGSGSDAMPNHEQHGYAFISTKTLEAITGQPANFNAVRIKTVADTDMDTIDTEIQNILGNRYAGMADQGSLMSVSYPLQKSRQIEKMSIMFSAIFILLALLTMQTTMTRLVSAQRMQIGTMKALGFRDGQIRLHYSAYGLTVGLLGGLLGLAIAPFTIAPALLRAQSTVYTLPEWPVRLTPFSYIMVAVVAICCTGATFIACRKGLAGMPAETMRGEAPRSGRQVLLEKMPRLWQKVSFGWKWTIRDISRSRIRSIMGMIGVLGCMMLLIASFGMQYTITGTSNYIYGTQYTYKSKAVVLLSATQENRKELQNIAGSGQWIEEKSIKYFSTDTNETETLTVLGNGDYVHLENNEGEVVSPPDSGVLITQRAANILKLKTGDTVTFRLSDNANALSAVVAGIVNTPSPQGIFISESAWAKLGESFLPTSLLMRNTEADSQISGLEYIQEVSTLQKQNTSAANNVKTFYFIFILLKMAAILLDVVILYNLGILSFTERTREYATLKVLGFYQKEIRSLALRENLTTALAGWIIGIPAGFCFLKQYVGAVSSSSLDMTPKLTPQDFILATLITVGCSTMVNLFLSHKVKKIDMVGALKSVE